MSNDIHNNVKLMKLKDIVKAARNHYWESSETLKVNDNENQMLNVFWSKSNFKCYFGAIETLKVLTYHVLKIK